MVEAASRETALVLLRLCGLRSRTSGGLSELLDIGNAQGLVGTPSCSVLLEQDKRACLKHPRDEEPAAIEGIAAAVERNDEQFGSGQLIRHPR